MTNGTHPNTEAEEMYLITIARAIEDGSVSPISVSDIASQLVVSGVSANQMVKKLEGLGLVEYTPYKGVALTAKGSERASSVLRRRRLWGLFLSEHLGLTPERADEVACEMEHITPEYVADRLSDFLGDPKFGPTGKPIPRGAASDAVQGGPLVDAAPGEDLIVLKVASPFDTSLSPQGAQEGAVVSVLASASNGTVVLATTEGSVNLSAEAAAAITVGPSS
jgi:DtxR family Mn-dependent transcriptional regulator